MQILPVLNVLASQLTLDQSMTFLRSSGILEKAESLWITLSPLSSPVSSPWLPESKQRGLLFGP